MKKCNNCKIEKSLDDFSVITKTNKPRGFCKECRNKKAKEYFCKNPEKILERNRVYHEKNREKIQSQQRDRYRKNREKICKRKIELKKPIDEIQREKNEKKLNKWCKENPEKKVKNAIRHKLKNPEKHMARTHVMWALKLGVLIKPNICEVCERNIKLEAHHTDYSKKLDVMWLCRTCHMHKHGKLLYRNPRG